MLNKYLYEPSQLNGFLVGLQRQSLSLQILKKTIGTAGTAHLFIG
jgi:hypothetical protein